MKRRAPALRDLALAELRQRVGTLHDAEALDELAAELDRRRTVSAIEAARSARLRARALRAVATRKKREAEKPVSLVPFLMRAGGIRDDGGELASMVDGDRRFRRLINPSGRSPDRAAMLALEGGYFPEHEQHGRTAITVESLGGALREAGAAAETMTPAILFDAIDEELRGRPRWPFHEAPDSAQEPDADREAADREAAERNAAMLWARLCAVAADEGVEGVYSFLFAGGVLAPEQEILPW